jgi:predicted MFS family arabinose efflux permease
VGLGVLGQALDSRTNSPAACDAGWVPSLWRDHDFLKLWTGQTISEIGSRITREGLPFTAAKLLGASPLQMGLLAALQGLLVWTAGPIAGVVADRYRHRPILIAADLGRAAALACIPLAALRGTLTFSVLIGVAAVSAALTVFFDVAYQAYLPRLVHRDSLLEGNSKLALSVSTAEVIGPGLTGVLIQWLTAPIAILLDSLSFLVSAATILFIRRPEHFERIRHTSEWREAAGGFRFVFANPLLRAIALRNAMAMLFMGFAGALYILYAVRDLHLSAAALGVVIMLGGISNLFGSLIAPRILLTFPLGWVLIGSATLPAVALCLIPLAPTNSWLAAAAFLGASQLLGDLGFPIYGIHETTLRQAVAPPELLGRVNACMQMLLKGVFPFGALAGGLLAASIGIRLTFAISALGVLMSSLWLVFSPVRRLRDHPS